MISLIELEKYVTNTGILDIVVSKLYHRKKLYLVILFKIDKDSKIGFYYNILPFDLTICLLVKSDGKFYLISRK